jgi:hypothetical protein
VETLNGLLVLLAGVLVRLALPAGLTLALAWLLRRLDARWQAEAAATRPVCSTTGTPCWETRQCPPERRATCAAYGQKALPCWQYFRDAQGNLRAECLGCEVFHLAPAPMPA